MNQAYLLTGANLGNREQSLQTARQHIERLCGPVRKASPLYETAAWGNTGQPAFLNQALMVQTSLSADALLQTILDIEKDMGRVRDEKYAPRSIDIDIIFFNRDIIDWPGLQVPHPHMHNRRFVLVPMAQLVPNKIHPVFNKSVQQLLDICPDPLPVQQYQPGTNDQ